MNKRSTQPLRSTEEREVDLSHRVEVEEAAFAATTTRSEHQGCPVVMLLGNKAELLVDDKSARAHLDQFCEAHDFWAARLVSAKSADGSVSKVRRVCR